jgi:hypothetical protein
MPFSNDDILEAIAQATSPTSIPAKRAEKPNLTALDRRAPSRFNDPDNPKPKSRAKLDQQD